MKKPCTDLKTSMKEKYLQEDSPDLLDSKMMKRVFGLKNDDFTVVKPKQVKGLNWAG